MADNAAPASGVLADNAAPASGVLAELEALPAKVQSAVLEFASSGQGATSGDIWAKGFGIGFAVISPVIAIGLTWSEDKIRGPDVRDDWDQDIALQVFLPVFLWYLISVKVTGDIAYHFGMDMLQESNAEMKRCVRSNMTTAGVVLALVLSIAMVMLQAENVFEDRNVRVAMWYRAFLTLSAEACIKGILTTSFFLVYMEPLNPKSAMVFTIDNINYLGEPVTCVLLSLFYFLLAIALWFYGMDGSYMGIFASAVLCFVIVRTVVVMMYLTRWKNPDVSEAERTSRMQAMKDAGAPAKQ